VQARARRTRQKIIDQAKRAFAEHGFDSANLTEHILTPAGVSVGSFYHQFANKREVLVEIFSTSLEARNERIRERLRTMTASSFADAYRTMLDAILDDVEADPDVWRIQFREHESPDPDLRDQALARVEDWSEIAIRLLGPHYPADHPELPAVAQMSAMLGSGLIREIAHCTPECQRDRRGELVDRTVRFAAAAAAGLLARVPPDTGSPPSMP
jgi:AcrR family transcriptional regulator